MSPTSESSHDRSSVDRLEDREWLDQAGDDFEAGWQADGALDRVRAYQHALLRELVRRDHELRQSRGTPLMPDEYAQAFPQLRGSDGSLPSELFSARQPSTIYFPPPQKLASSGPHEEPKDKGEIVPSSIDRYQVKRWLGGGGQADVYHAYDPPLNRDVVIKLSKRTLAGDSAFCQLLRAEAQKLAPLEHPNLVRVYDAGTYQDRPFLVMQYVEGCDLGKYVQGRRLTPREAAILTAQAARAVAAIHARNITHQDLKPGNLLIESDGKVRLIDFGLARVRDYWTDDAQQPEGYTPPYTSPEQTSGDIARVGPCSDIFSLGGILYFLLTGKAPFAAETKEKSRDKASRADFDRDALNAPGIPRRLRGICLRAMQVDPKQRYPRAEDMAAELEHFAHPSKLPWLAAAILLLLIIGSGAWWWLQPEPQPPSEQPGIAVIERVVKGEPKVYTPKTFADLLRPNLTPLHPGDHLRVRFAMPPNYQSALFCLDTQGTLHEIGPLRAEPHDRLVQLEWPDGWEVKGPSGTLVLLFCANRGRKPQRDIVQNLFAANVEHSAAWPRLRSRVALRLQQGEVSVEGEIPRGGDHPFDEVWRRFEQLRDGLRGRVDYTWAAALPQEADGP